MPIFQSAHLRLRGNVYCFRIVFPRPFRTLVKSGEIQISLGTSNLAEAKQLALQLTSECLRIFRHYQTVMSNNKLTPTPQALTELQAKVEQFEAEIHLL